MVLFPTAYSLRAVTPPSDHPSESPNNPPGESPPDSGGLRPALARVLRPLVKFLIARGVTAPATYALLKELYVEVARDSFRLEGKPPTDSRVSVLTGVHRKDVRALRGRVPERAPDRAPERRVTVMATVVGRWLADPEMTGADGSPRPLPRQAADGPSFDALVETVSTDVRPRTILDELLRRGVVALEAKGETVRLRAEALLPREAGEERLHFFARNLGDHMAAAVENTLTEGGQAPYLERAVYYNNLRAGSIEAIEARARALAGRALSELNRLGFDRQSADANPGGEGNEVTKRFRFGVYFYHEDEHKKGEE